ncbi:hypothetical protein ACGFNU_11705 [Spirillospora sp. NPDC048911]|uniref:hypothetical protein n=1 Tax=Spirillospora sp. NPDC048911 TaxID=3364527 RepID=UPI00371257F5
MRRSNVLRAAAVTIAAGVTVALVAVVVRGWGVRSTAVVSAGPAPGAGARGTITVFLVKKGKLVETTRPALPGFELLAINQLAAAPTWDEQSKGLSSEVPVAPLWGRWSGSSEIRVLEVTPALEVKWSRRALGQLACTGEAADVDGGVRVVLTKAPGTPEPPHIRQILSCKNYRDLR